MPWPGHSSRMAAYAARAGTPASSSLLPLQFLCTSATVQWNNSATKRCTCISAHLCWHPSFDSTTAHFNGLSLSVSSLLFLLFIAQYIIIFFFSLTSILNILSGICFKNFYLWVVSHKAKLFFWEEFGNKLSGLADSQPIIYSEKLLLFMSRLQSPQVCFSLGIIHGFSQWQIVGLQNVFFTIFHPGKAQSLRELGTWQSIQQEIQHCIALVMVTQRNTLSRKNT